MIYTDMTKKALKLCFEAHKNQVDKSGMPYVFHPFHLAEQIKENTIAKAVKLADLRHNSDMSRFSVSEITEEAIMRREKYLKTIALLKG